MKFEKKDQKYDFLLEDFNKMGLEYEKLKKGSKGKASNPTKKIKIEEDKKIKELQKEVEALKNQVHQAKKEASKALSRGKRSMLLILGRARKKILK